MASELLQVGNGWSSKEDSDGSVERHVYALRPLCLRYAMSQSLLLTSETGSYNFAGWLDFGQAFTWKGGC